MNYKTRYAIHVNQYSDVQQTKQDIAKQFIVVEIRLNLYHAICQTRERVKSLVRIR